MATKGFVMQVFISVTRPKCCNFPDMSCDLHTPANLATQDQQEWGVGAHPNNLQRRAECAPLSSSAGMTEA